MEELFETYNRRDLEGFLRLFAPDAQLYRPVDTLWLSGESQYRPWFTDRFQGAPSARATLLARITHGDFVIDRETITGLPGGESVIAVWMYEIKEGKIARAWVIP